MIRKTIVFAFVLLSCVACTSSTPRTHMGFEVIDMPFTIAGGETILLPVTDAGPVPAEDENYKIEFAGFFVGPSKSEESRAELVWGFGVSNKSNIGVASIIVEEVSPSDTAKTVLTVEAPEFTSGVWLGKTDPVPANRESTPWLFKPKASIYVYRFIIRSTKGTEVTLLQPAWFSTEAKASHLKKIEKMEGI